MATLADAQAIANALPDVTQTSGQRLGWAVHKQTFAWLRPYSKADLKRFVTPPPVGEILAIRVANLRFKEEMLADAKHPYLFSIPHFDGYPALLFYLEDVGLPELESLLFEAWQSVVAAQKKPKRSRSA